MPRAEGSARAQWHEKDLPKGRQGYIAVKFGLPIGRTVFSQPLYTLVNLCEILQLKKTLVNVLFTDKFSDPPRLSDYSSLLLEYEIEYEIKQYTQRKLRKSLEDKAKIVNFALSKHRF